MLDAALHAVICELIRTGTIDAITMQAQLMDRDEPDAAALIGACLVEVTSEDMPAPKPRRRLSIVPD